MYRRTLTLCAALLLVRAAAAADKPALKAGADLPGPFHPYNVANSKFDKRFHCLVAEHGLNPGVLVFVRGPQAAKDDALTTLLKELDAYAAKNPRTALRAFAVFLFPDLKDVVAENDTREARAGEVEALGRSAELQKVVLALSDEATLKAAGYDLDPQAQVVVVLYDRLKVRSVYPFPAGKLTEDEVKKVMAEVREKLAPVPARRRR